MLAELLLQCLQNLVRTYNMRRRLGGILLGLAFALWGHSLAPRLSRFYTSSSIPILYLGQVDGAQASLLDSTHSKLLRRDFKRATLTAPPILYLASEGQRMNFDHV